jgi:hypothetical protein
VRVGDVECHLIRIRTDGPVAIQLDWSSRKPPISGRDIRVQLRDRVHAVRGVAPREQLALGACERFLAHVRQPRPVRWAHGAHVDQGTIFPGTWGSGELVEAGAGFAAHELVRILGGDARQRVAHPRVS